MSSVLNIGGDKDQGRTYYNLSPEYSDAVNASRFVKGFGITALVQSLLLFTGINLLGAGFGIGVGLFIMRYDSQGFYKVLGIIVMVTAILGSAGALSPLILSTAVFWKGMEVLRTLSKEGKGDGDWEPTRSRALVGLVASAAAIVVSLLLIAFALLVLLKTIQGPR